jgi:hypothetical protein
MGLLSRTDDETLEKLIDYFNSGYALPLIARLLYMTVADVEKILDKLTRVELRHSLQTTES